MNSARKTAIVTGASQGIGAGIVKAFVERGFNVVANSLKNAVAPGVVSTPLHRDTPRDVMEGLSPMGRPSTVQDIADAVLYLTDAATVTGHVLYVDGGAHFGRW
jgi:NAD(P)-dependent dehydrogenase (short-subunit alcohol dehydrogenase family)